MKAGFKTTEFALTLVAAVVGVAMASGVFTEGDAVYRALAFLASSLATAGYCVGRGLAKGGAATKKKMEPIK